jgi:hypothetical protein
VATYLFGKASNPADNGTGVTAPCVVTPPGSMQAGDLVFVTVCFSGTSGTLTVSETGGQSWTSLTTRNQTRNRTRSFWCVFNGTWSANPSFTGSGSSNVIARMLVFRADGGTLTTWVVTAAESSATYAAPSTPFTVTHSGVTTLYDNDLVIVGWTSADDNTWGTLNGSTHSWTAVAGEAQIRNTSGTYQQSVTHAYMIDAAAGATGTAYQNQATLGGDAGTYIMIAFRAIEQHSGACAATGGGAIATAGVKVIPIVKVINETLTRTKYGSVAISTGTGATAVAGAKSGLGATLTSAAGAIVVLGMAGYAALAPSSISGGGAVAATGRKDGIAISAATGSGSLVATGAKAGAQANAVSCGGVLAVTGSKGASGAGAITGSGSVVVATSKGGQGAGAESAAGSVSASGYKDGRYAPSITAAGAVSGSGSKGGAGGIAITASGFVTVTGEKPAGLAIVKVVNEALSRVVAFSGAASCQGAGTIAATGNKSVTAIVSISGRGAVSSSASAQVSQAIVKVINEVLQKYSMNRTGTASVSGSGHVVVTSGFQANPLVKVINEQISKAPTKQCAAVVSGRGSVVVVGEPNARALVQVINEVANQVEGSFDTAYGYVHVIDEATSVVETKIRRTAFGATGDSSVAGSGHVSTQGRKSGFGATQVSGAGAQETTAVVHALGAEISGGGTISVSVTGAHYGRPSVSGGGSVVAAAGAPPTRRYKRSFTRAKTGNPIMDRQLQLIEEEFSRMLDYINRTTG